MSSDSAGKFIGNVSSVLFTAVVVLLFEVELSFGTRRPTRDNVGAVFRDFQYIQGYRQAPEKPRSFPMMMGAFDERRRAMSLTGEFRLNFSLMPTVLWTTWVLAVSKRLTLSREVNECKPQPEANLL